MTYKHKTNPLILSGVVGKKERSYTMLFRDLPKEDRPKEKLDSLGVSSLSIAELIAIILNTGTKKEDVLAMSSRVMKEYGEKSLLTQTDPKKVASDLHIPIGKTMQIVASVELGRRLFEKKNGFGKTLRTAQDVFEHTKDMRELPKEHLRGIYLNTQYKIIHEEVLSIGTIDANIVHAREVFRPAIERSAAAVILVHNHPSGNTLPSKADKDVTSQIKEAGEIIGIPLLDHVIVTMSGYKSALE